MKINNEEAIKTYFWRQYAQRKVTSDSAVLKTKWTRDRGLDPKDAKKYPQIAYIDNVLGINDKPGVSYPFGNAVLRAKVINDDSGKVLASPLPQKLYEVVQDNINTEFGKPNTTIEISMETQLIHDVNGPEKEVGNWAWNFTMTWPEKGNAFSFKLEITSAKWTANK